MHKTGTTSVQRVLLKNSEILQKLGYRAFVNSLQMSVKREEYFDPDWLRHQVELAEKEGMQAVIFSAETISTFNSKQLNRLLEPFHGHDVCIIACLRHWVNFLPSRWAQNCIRRDTQSFPAYLENLQKHDKVHIDARFDIVVGRMIDANPQNSRIISYDNAASFGELLPTCLSAFDLPQNFVNNFKGANLRANIRRDYETTELARLFNGLYSQRNNLECNKMFMGICKAIPVNRYYSIYKKIPLVLQNHKKLKKQLIGMLRENKMTMVLSQNDTHIARWERMVEQESNGYVINLHNDRLFADVSDIECVCSKIEINDIPLKIREKMENALRIVEP